MRRSGVRLPVAPRSRKPVQACATFAIRSLTPVPFPPRLWAIACNPRQRWDRKPNNGQIFGGGGAVRPRNPRAGRTVSRFRPEGRWFTFGAGRETENVAGERQPPTGTVQRTRHVRITARRGTEKQGGGSLDRSFVRRYFHLPLPLGEQIRLAAKRPAATAISAPRDGSGNSAMLSTPVTSPKWSK